ncbi:hypothetical protein [Novosphingobium resinovorum]|uniref:Uncharacterized protein n=1 Tax=Novosphingobium resinovorum TaxID=158500 RepID=A0A1D8A502_9SPHN|nr:hypothetical protein [Novosphingobium resinovorum]AOR77193.1 hypothetical protein BES08_10860 [Novosphingobium resinovorum]
MIAPGTPLSQSAGRNSPTPRVPEVPTLPAASGAAAGTLHLTQAEEERVAAHVRRVWKGVTGLPEVPSSEQLAALISIALRKARDEIAGRAH